MIRKRVKDLKQETTERRFFTEKEVGEMLGMSRNTVHRLAIEAEALVRIGTRNVRIDVPKLYQYLELVGTVAGE